MEINKKILVIGLDGATFDLIKPWADAGELPTFKKLMEEGVWGELESTIPHVTPPAWTSMTTGKNPGKHGIFDFMSIEKTDEEWKLKLYNSRSKRSREIWDYLMNKKSIVVNVPLTYPPRPINGLMITGMYTPSIKSNFTYPKELKDEILHLFPNYRIELNWNEYKGKEQKFLDDLYMMTNERIKLFWHLFEKEWDFFFFVFVGTDRLQHIMWNYKALLKYYQYIDEFLKNVVSKMNDKNFALFIVSDHGFSKIKKVVSINTFLKKQEYLKDKGGSNLAKNIGISKENLSQLLTKLRLNKIYTNLPPRILHFLRKIIPGVSNPVYDFNLANSKAIMVGTGSIFIIEKKKHEKERIQTEIMTKLENLIDPETGEKIIEKLYKKEEIFSGPLLNNAPDLLILPKKGYSMVHKLSSKIIEKPGFKKADHALYGIFLAYGHGIKKGCKIDNAKIYDIAPTVLHMFGLPIPKDMDGKVLMEIFEENSELAKRKPEYVEPGYYEKKEEKDRIREKIRELKSKGKI